MFDNLFDLFQVTLSKMAKHWDSFLSDCNVWIDSKSMHGFCEETILRKPYHLFQCGQT